jgi:hypothetical protein
MVIERVWDLELRGEPSGGLLGAAGHCDDLEVVEDSQGGDVAVLGPAAGTDDADADLAAAHDLSLRVRCPCVLLMRRVGLSGQERSRWWTVLVHHASTAKGFGVDGRVVLFGRCQPGAVRLSPEKRRISSCSTTIDRFVANCGERPRLCCV